MHVLSMSNLTKAGWQGSPILLSSLFLVQPEEHIPVGTEPVALIRKLLGVSLSFCTQFSPDQLRAYITMIGTFNNKSPQIDLQHKFTQKVLHKGVINNTIL